MCGFAGFLHRNGLAHSASEIACAMSAAIRHRGPDDQGIWIDPAAGIALAHCRLSIVDLSPAGHQPMLSQSGRYVIVFNGEIYNYTEVRSDLEKAIGPKAWRGHSDTEVLIEAISHWGVEGALKRCAGMFAFALWDCRDRTLTLARDRLGEKPLYYGTCGQTFLFGSDLAALAVHPEWRGDIDRDALSAMMQFNNVPAPLSIYRGIRKLMPGSYRVFSPGDADGREHIYWNASAIAQAGLENPFRENEDAAIGEVEKLIRQSLAGQMVADVPLGAFLSGGVDSSTIVALMQDMSSRPVKTFSIGFKEDSHNEAGHARAVACHLGTDHHEAVVTAREAQAVIPKLPTIYSEPFADSSQIPTFLVAELARRHVSVSLSGDAGDELFSGYRRHGLAYTLLPKLTQTPRALRAGLARMITNVRPQTWDRLASIPNRLLGRASQVRQAGDKLHKTARILALDDADEVYRALVSHWPEPSEIVPGAKSQAALPALTSSLDHASPLRRMMFRDMTGYLADDILVKVDRASMAVSLESRIPFLDHRLVEFSWRLPMSVLWHKGQSKGPLRRILYRHVPRELIERPKTGFAIPLAEWLRGDLRPWAEDLLSEGALKRHGDFDPRPVRALWSSFLLGSENSQDQIWNVLMFQAWRQSANAVKTHQPLPSAAAAGIK
jgi:asparagine synthase (glutamine-hydrolysing)